MFKFKKVEYLRKNSGIGEFLQSLNNAWVFTGGGIDTDTTVGV